MTMLAVPAGELIVEGRCSPSCLLAMREEADGCACRCGGEFHAALKDVPIEARPLAAPWWVQCSFAGWSPAELRASAHVARTPRESTRLHREAKRQRNPFTEVAKISGGWSVRWDAITTSCVEDSRWPAREAALLNRVVCNLLRTGRAVTGSVAPCEYFSVYPLRDFDEACVLWQIVSECWFGNPAGAVRAIEVLEGRGDPVEAGLNPERGYPETLAVGHGVTDLVTVAKQRRPAG